MYCLLAKMLFNVKGLTVFFRQHHSGSSSYVSYSSMLLPITSSFFDFPLAHL